MKLTHRSPLDWNGLVTWLAARAIPGVEEVDNGVYARAGVRVSHDGENVIVDGALRPDRRIQSVARGDRASPESQPPASPEHDCPLPAKAGRGDRVRGGTRDTAPSRAQDDSLVLRVRRLFDLDADPSAIHAVLSRDPMLGPLLRKRPGVRVPGTWDPFELAVRAIVGQQVSVAGARTILGRIAAKHGLSAGALAEVDVEGMPRKRAETIRILARAVVNGEILIGRDDLTQLPGIGPWTASYIAMRLGDRDAFPAGDLVLRRKAGGLSERELLQRAEAWRPFRAYGAMLVWTG